MTANLNQNKQPHSALLLVAHGSRRTASNDEVKQLVSQLQQLPGNPHDVCACAFLELSEPGIADSIDLLVDKGCRTITVVPYFLAAGRHVAEDLPREIDAKRQQHPQTQIHLTQHLGCAPEMAALILQMA